MTFSLFKIDLSEVFFVLLCVCVCDVTTYT